MEGGAAKTTFVPQFGNVQIHGLRKYILETSVYPREPSPLRELREITASHPGAMCGTAPDSGQLLTMLLKMMNPIKTIELGVFTGYSLLLTALAIPHNGQIAAIDIDREAYQMGLPIIQKAGVDHKINFIHSQALPVLDEFLENREDAGSFDFAFVDADKTNYLKYHERLKKLIRIGGIIVYDNTLWAGTVAMPEEAVPETTREVRRSTIEFNQSVAADHSFEISLVPIGDGITICRRII